MEKIDKICSRLNIGCDELAAFLGLTYSEMSDLIDGDTQVSAQTEKAFAVLEKFFLQ